LLYYALKSQQETEIEVPAMSRPAAHRHWNEVHFARIGLVPTTNAGRNKKSATRAHELELQASPLETGSGACARSLYICMAVF
jgi:hypothetical protein